MTRVLVAPFGRLVLVRGLNDQRLEAWYARFGAPAVERAGVPGRRVAFAHDWSAEEVAWIEARIAGLSGVSLATSLPADWRWPAYALE